MNEIRFEIRKWERELGELDTTFQYRINSQEQLKQNFQGTGAHPAGTT